MLLIADSGSTKTQWCLTGPDSVLREIRTDGINPYHMTAERIQEITEAQLLPALEGLQPERIYFYGAGCNQPQRNRAVIEALQHHWKDTPVEVASDMLGAARSLCGREDGMACILGTGANSCLFEGGRITGNTAPMGYILGDEGSGAVLGRLLVADWSKHQLPDDLSRMFEETYKTDTLQVIEAVYRQPQANRYLASFCPFLSRNIEHPYIQQLVRSEFTRFVQRNLDNYKRKELPVHFTGSVAWVFRGILTEVLTAEGYRAGRIRQAPMEGLLAYHRATPT
ncbi:MAG: ATPase [Paludibacteraceae bacterium]|nr:ATPase [Paludibacteraceae bacterium]